MPLIQRNDFLGVDRARPRPARPLAAGRADLGDHPLSRQERPALVRSAAHAQTLSAGGAVNRLRLAPAQTPPTSSDASIGTLAAARSSPRSPVLPVRSNTVKASATGVIPECGDRLPCEQGAELRLSSAPRRTAAKAYGGLHIWVFGRLELGERAEDGLGGAGRARSDPPGLGRDRVPGQLARRRRRVYGELDLRHATNSIRDSEFRPRARVQGLRRRQLVRRPQTRAVQGADGSCRVDDDRIGAAAASRLRRAAPRSVGHRVPEVAEFSLTTKKSQTLLAGDLAGRELVGHHLKFLEDNRRSQSAGHCVTVAPRAVSCSPSVRRSSAAPGHTSQGGDGDVRLRR